MCIDWVSECQKYAWTKLPDVCHYEGQKKPAGIKLQYFCQYGDKKKQKQPKNKVKHIYFRYYRIRIDHKV
jgi:hypothetical protein